MLGSGVLSLRDKEGKGEELSGGSGLGHLGHEQGGVHSQDQAVGHIVGTKAGSEVDDVQTMWPGPAQGFCFLSGTGSRLIALSMEGEQVLEV